MYCVFFFFQAEDGIRDVAVTGVQTCALPIYEKAAERLVTANLRFVISYVKKYQGHGLDLSELVAIGNEGLLKAVKKIDPDQGGKFISYAEWWLPQADHKPLAAQTRGERHPLTQH